MEESPELGVDVAVMVGGRTMKFGRRRCTFVLQSIYSQSRINLYSTVVEAA